MKNGKTATAVKTLPLRRLFVFLICSFLCFGLIAPAALPPVTVYAAGAGTLKAFLIGMSALMGVGNIDANSVSYLNSNTVLNAPIEDFVGDNPIYTAADINQALASNEGVARWTAGFANNAANVKVAQEYISSAGGDPSGLNGAGAATAGENIISSMRFGYNNYKTNGNWDLRPSIGGQTMTDALNATAVMASMADVAYNYDNFIWYAREAGLTQEEIDACYDSGAAFGSLENAQDYLQNRNKSITSGVPVDVSEALLNVPNGLMGYGAYYRGGYHIGGVSPSEDIKVFFYRTSSNVFSGFVANRSNRNYSFTTIDNATRVVNINAKSKMSTSGRGSVTSASVFNAVYFEGANAYENCESAVDSFIASAPTGEEENIKSPSLVGSEGQLSGSATEDPDTNAPVYNINVSPTTNYVTNKYGLPSDEDIATYISDIQIAIEQGETQENIGTIFQNFVQSMAYEAPAEPIPTAATVVPVQPTVAPKPTLTPEQEAQNTEIMGTGELKDKFPFCIPWDIAGFLTALQAEPEAPAIQGTIDLGPAGEHEINLDLSDYDEAAAIFRIVELIAFAVGLALVTRSLIGAGGK